MGFFPSRAKWLAEVQDLTGLGKIIMMFMYKQVIHNPIPLNTVKMKSRQIIFLKYVRSHIISKGFPEVLHWRISLHHLSILSTPLPVNWGFATESPKVVYRHSVCPTLNLTWPVFFMVSFPRIHQDLSAKSLLFHLSCANFSVQSKIKSMATMNIVQCSN